MKDRTTRQIEIIDKWENNNYIGGIVAITGFGKTNTGLLGIKRLCDFYMDTIIIIVVVPTEVLKDQWTEKLKDVSLIQFRVIIVNTAIKNNYDCDLLIIDEVHVIGSPTFRNVFDTINYKNLLWLTASIERADGEEKLILEKAPIIDIISKKEALENNWISCYTTYILTLDFTIEEREQYLSADNRVRYCMANFGNAYKAIGVRKHICYNAVNKIYKVEEIFSYFKNRKILIFSKSIEFSKKIKDLLGEECGIYHSKKNKKLNKESIKAFSDGEIRAMASVTSLNAGVDIPDCDLLIVASGDKTQITKTQQEGRGLRYIEGKKLIIIYLCIKNSVEEKWLKEKLSGEEIIYIKSVTEII